MDERQTSVVPVHHHAKDTFFKKVYESETRLKELAGFLIGKDAGKTEIKNLRPVLYGNKENDLAFCCDDFIYFLMEEQSSICMNLPFRCAEYMMTMLRESVDTESLLYGRKRVALPFPKLYGVNVGLAEKKQHLSETVQYDMRLSDSYEKRTGYDAQFLVPDLEAVVHIYDFRMTPDETYCYLDEEILPERLTRYAGDLLNYALTANTLTYVQRALKRKEDGKYPLPEGITSEADLFQLLMDRGIFVDLFQNKEVCDMTVAQFSRDDMLRYQGREEGMEAGIEKGMEAGIEKGMEAGIEKGREEGMKKGIRLTKRVIRLDAEGYAVNDIATELQISEEEVKKILEE